MSALKEFLLSKHKKAADQLENLSDGINHRKHKLSQGASMLASLKDITKSISRKGQSTRNIRVVYDTWRDEYQNDMRTLKMLKALHCAANEEVWHYDQAIKAIKWE